MTIQRNKLFFNFSSLGIVQVSNNLLSILIIPLVWKKIGAGNFGVVAVAQVVMIYLAVLTEYGFDQTATRDIAIHKNSNDSLKISQIFSAVLISKMIICVLCFVLLMILLLTVPIFNEHFFLYTIAFSFVIGQTLMINWFFMGMERMQYITIPTLLGRIIFVMLAFIFIRRSTDSFLFLFFMGIGNIIAALLSIYLAFRIYKLKLIQPGWREILNNLKNGWQITASNLSITSCQYIGIFILRISSGSDILVGYYGIAEKIYFAIKLMVNVFTQVVYPQVCQMMQKGKEQVISLLRQIYLPFLLFVFLGCVGVFLFSPEILYVFIGHKHDETSFYLKIFCIAVIIVCLNIPAALVLLADNHKKSYLRVFAIATVVHLTGNILLAHYFQAIGTVMAMIITELFITIALYWEAYNVFFSRKEKLIST